MSESNNLKEPEPKKTRRGGCLYRVIGYAVIGLITPLLVLLPEIRRAYGIAFGFTYTVDAEVSYGALVSLLIFTIILLMSMVCGVIGGFRGRRFGVSNRNAIIGAGIGGVVPALPVIGVIYIHYLCQIDSIKERLSLQAKPDPILQDSSGRPSVQDRALSIYQILRQLDTSITPVKSAGSGNRQPGHIGRQRSR